MRKAVSKGKRPKVEDRRYLRPDEAHRLIDAASKRGRYPFRDKVLVRLVYRHGLRASEAVTMRWSQVDLDAGVLHVARVKESIDCTHSLDRDELRDLRKLRQQVTGLYVFETERGGPLSVARCNTSSARRAGSPSWMSKHTRICCDTRPATCWRARAPTHA
jgi:type 1 fimbriae regulatory protein FimB/type 1 fimbriae regulatory protein FimE